MIPKSAVSAAGELLIKAQKNVDDFFPFNSVRYSKPTTPRVSQPTMTPDPKGKGKAVPGFEQHTGGEVRRTPRPQLPDKEKQEYLQYGQDYYAKNKTLKGAMKVNYEGDVIGLKKNSGLRKDGTPSIKTRNETQGKAYQDEGRIRKEQEQTYGEDAYKTKKGHHRAGVDLIDRLQEGLGASDQDLLRRYARKRFGALGNEDFNLDQLPDDVHNMVHTELKKLGFDSERMDFRSADLQTRLKFIRAIEKVLKKLDEKTFAAMHEKALAHGREGVSNY